MTRSASAARRRFALGTALAAFAALPALAQGFPQGGQIVAAGAAIGVSGAYGQSNGVINAANAGTVAGIAVLPGAKSRGIINWDSFELAAGNTLNFSGPKGYAVLNRVATGPARINGTINAIDGIAGSATGAIWVLSPGGLLFGSQSVVNAGSFVGATAQLADGDFLAGGPYRFTAGSGTIDIAAGARLATSGGPLLLVASRIASAGTLSAKDGDTALVAAEDATVALNATSLIAVDLPKGTPVSSDALVVGSVPLPTSPGRCSACAARSSPTWSRRPATASSCSPMPMPPAPAPR